MSENHQRARVTRVTVKRPPDAPEQARKKPEQGEKLTRNCAAVALLLIGLLTVRNAELPSGRTVMTAVRAMTGADWTDGIGRITFVSALFPETAAVFFDQSSLHLTAPCSGDMTHAWQREEPYIGYQNAAVARAALRGTVEGIGHGVGEERIVRLSHENGYETLYYNLETTPLSLGDTVDAGQTVGVPLDQTVFFEVRRGGVSVDPAPFLPGRVL